MKKPHRATGAAFVFYPVEKSDFYTGVLRRSRTSTAVLVCVSGSAQDAARKISREFPILPDRFPVDDNEAHSF